MYDIDITAIQSSQIVVFVLSSTDKLSLGFPPGSCEIGILSDSSFTLFPETGDFGKTVSGGIDYYHPLGNQSTYPPIFIQGIVGQKIVFTGGR